MNVQEKAWINYHFNLIKTAWRSKKILCDVMKQNVKRPNLWLYDFKSQKENVKAEKMTHFFSFSSDDEHTLISWGDIPTAILYFWVFY